MDQRVMSDVQVAEQWSELVRNHHTRERQRGRIIVGTAALLLLMGTLLIYGLLRVGRAEAELGLALVVAFAVVGAFSATSVRLPTCPRCGHLPQDVGEDIFETRICGNCFAVLRPLSVVLSTDVQPEPLPRKPLGIP